MNRVRATLALHFAAILLIAHPALADVSGRITGTVKDQTDAAVAGVTVIVVNSNNGTRQSTSTDSQGLYSFPVLSVGQYELDVVAAGFRPYRRTGLMIDVNSALVVDVSLQVAERNETVTVTEAGDSVQVEKADTEMGQTISEKQITEVPLNGRSYTAKIFADIPLRSSPEEPNDQPEALAVIIVDYDGQNPAKLVTGDLAPQRGSPTHYDSFLSRVCDLYRQRFAAR